MSVSSDLVEKLEADISSAQQEHDANLTLANESFKEITAYLWRVNEAVKVARPHTSDPWIEFRSKSVLGTLPSYEIVFGETKLLFSVEPTHPGKAWLSRQAIRTFREHLPNGTVISTMDTGEQGFDIAVLPTALDKLIREELRRLKIIPD